MCRLAAIPRVLIVLLVGACTARPIDSGKQEAADADSESSNDGPADTLASESTSNSGNEATTEGETTTDAETTTEETTTEETTTDTETTTETETTTDTETTTETETGEPNDCGNGMVEGDELCDEGLANAWEGACKPDCTPAICGDGHVGPGELCDGPQCSDDCQMPASFCGNAIFECGDLLDNDMDGLIDLHDPDCLSPCDDKEVEYLIDLPTGSDDCFLDCYFDSNGGKGDDLCNLRMPCDPLEPQANTGCPYDPNYQNCDPQVEPCLGNCQPLTPNGCDCFGCCFLAGEYRLLDSGPDCSAATPENCHLCTPHFECANPCEPENCELCFGQTIADLPLGCVDPACPNGVDSCSDPYACGPGLTCKAGCCLAFDVP
jgi:hypothetical protein